MKRIRGNMIIAVILFVAVLFLTELSPFSSRAVALVNGGYGTFDMKSYDANTFIRVMEAVRRHIVGGTNRALISVETPIRLCRIGTCRRLSAGLPQIVVALFEEQLCCF